MTGARGGVSGQGAPDDGQWIWCLTLLGDRLVVGRSVKSHGAAEVSERAAEQMLTELLAINPPVERLFERVRGLRALVLLPIPNSQRQRLLGPIRALTKISEFSRHIALTLADIADPLQARALAISVIAFSQRPRPSLSLSGRRAVASARFWQIQALLGEVEGALNVRVRVSGLKHGVGPQEPFVGARCALDLPVWASDACRCAWLWSRAMVLGSGLGVLAVSERVSAADRRLAAVGWACVRRLFNKRDVSTVALEVERSVSTRNLSHNR